MLRLSDEQIWKVQQGNSHWEDKDKGRAVADAQLAHLAMTPKEVRGKLARLRHDNFGCGSHKCPHWQRDCFNYDWVVSNGLCKEMLDQICVLTEARITEARKEGRKGIINELLDLLEKNDPAAPITIKMYHVLQALLSDKESK